MPMEKQNTVENQLAHTIAQTEFDSDYDKTAKKLLANKQILAQIMKSCVDEYSECSVEEIAEKYIEGTPEVGTVGVHVDDFEVSGCAAFLVKSGCGEKENSRRRVWRCNE